MMIRRSTRPPVSFVTAGWVGIAAGWALGVFARVASWVAGVGQPPARDETSQLAGWWQRTTQMGILLVLAGGATAAVGVGICSPLLGPAVGLTGSP